MKLSDSSQHTSKRRRYLHLHRSSPKSDGRLPCLSRTPAEVSTHAIEPHGISFSAFVFCIPSPAKSLRVTERKREWVEGGRGEGCDCLSGLRDDEGASRWFGISIDDAWIEFVEANLRSELCDDLLY